MWALVLKAAPLLGGIPPQHQAFPQQLHWRGHLSTFPPLSLCPSALGGPSHKWVASSGLVRGACLLQQLQLTDKTCCTFREASGCAGLRGLVIMPHLWVQVLHKGQRVPLPLPVEVSCLTVHKRLLQRHCIFDALHMLLGHFNNDGILLCGVMARTAACRPCNCS